MRKLVTAGILTVLVAIAGIAQSAGSLEIHDIQGRGHVTPYLRQEVEGVRGIVTAVTLGTGFYMQCPEPDDDPGTSEGIFVDTTTRLDVAVGDLVSVSGRADEQYTVSAGRGDLPITVLRRVDVEVLRHGQTVPAPTVIGTGGRIPPGEVICDDADGSVADSFYDPENDGIDFYESLEGMLVQVNDAVSVGTVHTTYGEIFVVPDGGAHASVLTPRGGIVLREGDFNPDRVLIDYIPEEPMFRNTATMRQAVGDRFTEPIVGVISYSYLNYKIAPLEPLPPVIPNPLPREVATPARDDQLSVATFNVYNLSARNPEEKFVDLAETIVAGLHSPDILVLEEVQDDDGARHSDVVSAAGTIDVLLSAIDAAGGPTDYEYVDIAPEYNRDGGEPDGNIRVGFLYRTSRVLFVDAPHGDATTSATLLQRNGEPELAANPSRIDPENRAFVNSRKPLVGEFIFQGHRLFVIGNHFNSKSGDNGPFGAIQPPNFRSEPTRIAQAEAVSRFVDELLAVDPDALIIVAGDLNDYTFAPPVRTLEGDGRLVNLVPTLLPVDEVYTYIYEGNSQALDHILVSQGLFQGWQPEVDVVHRYCEYLYEERWSDHDPVLARFTPPR